MPRRRRTLSSRTELPDMLPPVKAGAACSAFSAATRRWRSAVLCCSDHGAGRRSSRPISSPSTRPRWRPPGARARLRRSSGSARTCWAATSIRACSTAHGSRCRRLLGGGTGFPRRPRHRPDLRLRALGRQHRHAGHGRADVDPADPARHRADGTDPRQRRQRHHGHHRRRNAARFAAGARRGAVVARAALCGGGDRRRHANADDHPAPHPAQHAGADAGAGNLHLRQRDDRRSRSSPSSAPARRPPSRPGATSWPRAGRCGR